jgi:hypothetical protein
MLELRLAMTPIIDSYLTILELKYFLVRLVSPLSLRNRAILLCPLQNVIDCLSLLMLRVHKFFHKRLINRKLSRSATVAC